MARIGFSEWRNSGGPGSAARRGPRQDVTLAGVIGGPDHPLVLHLLDQRGGAVVADLQPALDIAGGGLAVAGDHGHGAVVEIVARAGLAEAAVGLLVLLGQGGDLLEILRLALLA